MSDLFNTLKLYEKLQNTREPASGSVSSIDGKLVDIRCLGHSMILRNVKVNGDVSKMSVGDAVTIKWVNGVPSVDFSITKDACPTTPVVTYAAGSNGANGADGINGVDGLNGLDGIDGLNGADGINLLDTKFWAMIGQPTDVISSVRHIIPFGVGKLCAVGEFEKIGGVSAKNVAVFDIATTTWSALGEGVTSPGGLYSVFELGGDLYAGIFGSGNTWGAFISDPIYWTGFYKWDGSEWSYVKVNIFEMFVSRGYGSWRSFGGSLGGSVALGFYNGVPYAIDVFRQEDNSISIGTFSVHKFVDNSWELVHRENCYADDVVLDIAQYGSSLVVAGSFWRLSRPTTGLKIFDDIDNIVFAQDDRYLFADGISGICTSLISDASGIYISGSFTDKAYNIVRYVGGSWNNSVFGGGTWESLDTGLNSTCYSITSQDGSLYAGGLFTTAGDKNVVKIAAYLPNLYAILRYLANYANQYTNEYRSLHPVLWGEISGTLAQQTDLQMVLDGKVALNGEQTIAGVKTFIDFPLSPEAFPTSEYQFVNKKYVDEFGGGGGSFSGDPSRVLLTDALGAPITSAMFRWDHVYERAFFGQDTNTDFLPQTSKVNILPHDGGQSVLSMASWGNESPTSPTFLGYRAFGTPLTPTATGADAKLFNIGGLAYNGSNWVGTLARILIKTTEQITPTNQGAGVFFEGTPKGSTTRIELGSITEDGFNIPAGAEYLIGGQPISSGSSDEKIATETEDLSSLCDGVSTHFPISGTADIIHVYLNGLRQTPSGVQIDEDCLGFSLPFAPDLDDSLIVDYPAIPLTDSEMNWLTDSVGNLITA